MSGPFIFIKGCTLKKFKVQFFLYINVIKLKLEQREDYKR
ncbi:hypothetical protein K144313037_16880 [Clostridium tetani]|nr:hypothetical protein BN906_02037 [Clostridium tetani 12124569]BDR70276.1 hypothetical protein K144313037_16880 [Clostridium tetani]BDR73048.1 hypothetical protein K144316041_17560 [Clostridium tetani]BDR78820.1 hypothetical protein K154307017_17530 [Clostridium tetani]BDR84348.1 hypothetical protein K254310026_17590 [Clostridium tetani]